MSCGPGGRRFSAQWGDLAMLTRLVEGSLAALCRVQGAGMIILCKNTENTAKLETVSDEYTRISEMIFPVQVWGRSKLELFQPVPAFGALQTQIIPLLH